MSVQERLFLKKIKKLEEQKLKVIKNKKITHPATNKRPLEDEDTNNKRLKTDGNCNEDNENRPTETSVNFEIFSNQTFDCIKDKICDRTYKALMEKGFTRMTEIQARTIPLLLDGKDLVGTAKTGSGKTLAFLIPVIELMYKLQFKPRNGTGAIIISPTRELSLQTYSVLSNLMKYHSHTYGLIIGKTNMKEQSKKLSKGVNILIATPGRLLDHMQNTPDFMYKNLQCLVLDETDRILDIGFEEEIHQIVKLLPKRRQTIMFSATQNNRSELLETVALKKEPIRITIGDKIATVTTLEQGFLIVPSEKRLIALYNILMKELNKKRKIMVFFSSCNSVDFHAQIIGFLGIKLLSIHGKQKQEQRFRTYRQFSRITNGILFCTDVVSRGLDFAGVDLVIQYDPPEDALEYIHRVGRTARGEGSCGRAFLFLRFEECRFLGYLTQAQVPLKQFEAPINDDDNLQQRIESIVSGYVVLKLAREGFVSFIRAYKAHRLKDAFNFDTLDLDKVAVSFGLRKTPSLEPETPEMNDKRPKKQKFDKYPRNEQLTKFKQNNNTATKGHQSKHNDFKGKCRNKRIIFDDM